VIEPTALERGTTRAIGSVAYCSNGFQSVAYFRLRKIEMRLQANRLIFTSKQSFTFAAKSCCPSI
jgi:hypothetical protein